MNIKKFTVEVRKEDGARSVYHVLAATNGGAENTCLDGVYSAKYALARDGWPAGVQSADLLSNYVLQSIGI